MSGGTQVPAIAFPAPSMFTSFLESPTLMPASIHEHKLDFHEIFYVKQYHFNEDYSVI